MNRLYEMDTRGAVSTITINVFFFIIFGYIKLNALLLSDDFFLHGINTFSVFSVFLPLRLMTSCDVRLRYAETIWKFIYK